MIIFCFIDMRFFYLYYSTTCKYYIFFFMIAASCSITTGMCLEWTWSTAAAKIDDCAYYRYNHLKILKSTLYFGAVISAGPTAFVSSLAGLRAVLFASSSITAIGSAVIMYSADILSWLYVGRLLQGLGVGIVFVAVPNYASEISKPKPRSEHFIRQIKK